jgi:hypothetical protein
MGFEPTTFCMASRRSSQLSYSRKPSDYSPALGSRPPGPRAAPVRLRPLRAPWRSGYAAACKAVYTGSIPVGAFDSRAKSGPR